jgi:3'-5' exoribonuclease
MSAPRLTVADLRSSSRASGDEFEAVVVLRKCASRTARNDNSFLAVELGDRTGSFSTNVFSDNPLADFFKSAPEGSAVVVSGKIDFYQGRFSPRLHQARRLDEADLERLGGVETLVETSPEQPEALAAQLAEAIARIAHEPLRRTVEFAFETAGPAFRVAPAAVSMHHAYRFGLLEHTVHVARAAAALLPLYPEVSADLAMAGALVHDVGKALEHEGALAPRKTRLGLLQGHVVLGYRIVRRAAIKAKLDAGLLERLEHIVLSHQGELEWGAATLAATPEAVFVSMVDNLDAKMGMVQRALRTGDAAEFSDFLPGLKVQLLRPAPLFPEAPPDLPPAP